MSYTTDRKWTPTQATDDGVKKNPDEETRRRGGGVGGVEWGGVRRGGVGWVCVGEDSNLVGKQTFRVLW